MSDVAAPAPQPQPLVMFQGQPYNSESAGAERARLMADGEYAKAALNGSVEHQQRLSALWQIEHWGRSPDPAPTNFAEARAQTDQRDHEERRAVSAAFFQNQGLTARQVHEVQNRRPCLQGEHDWHQQQLSLLKSDRSFTAKYLAGDREARALFTRHVQGAAFPIGTLDQIKAWEAAHPYPEAV
jgi:hypothetical protein